METYPLDDATIQTVTDLKTQMRPFEVAMYAVLTTFARQHKLQGTYALAENGRELILNAAPVASDLARMGPQPDIAAE